MMKPRISHFALIALWSLAGQAPAQTVFFDDFESDLSQWNFPSPNLHGFTGANMTITGSEVFEGSGSATFNIIVVSGNAYTDRIPVAPGETYRLQAARKGPDAAGGGFIGFSLFGADSDASYIREHWAMGPSSTMDFQSVGAIKPTAP